MAIGGKSGFLPTFMRLVITFLAGSVAASGADDEIKKTATAFFQEKIEPVLRRRCFACHSHESGKAKGGLVLDSRQGWAKGGSEGPAIIPGNPADSLLMSAVRHEGYEMPPGEKIPAQEIDLLHKWVLMGAPDPRTSKSPRVDPERLWALQPIAKPEVPSVKDESWLRDDLDAFVLARLEMVGLPPATDADRYTLLRRVTLDLTGLPPTPEQIRSFLNDHSENAYQNVVDQLLASDGFGDHWARHWFDLSCYADLADIQGNTLIRDAWRYRDYVIGAINADKPLDRFIHEQIAGDLLPSENDKQRREQIIATGYLAIGPWTLQNYIKKQLDADVVDHQIDRIGRTFLAQTISCARCHDHKFDPIPTSDYYALAGIFHSTLTTSYDGPGVWSAIHETQLPKLHSSPEDQHKRKAMLVQLRRRQTELQNTLTTLRVQIPGGSDANILTLKEPIAANTKGSVYEVSFRAGPSVWAAAVQQTTAEDGLRVDIIRADGSILQEFRHSPGAWPGKQGAQKLHEALYRYTGDGSGDVRIRITSAMQGTSRFGGAIDDLVVTQTNDSPKQPATKGDAGDTAVVKTPRASSEREPRIIFEEHFNSEHQAPIKGQQADTGLSVWAGVQVPGWEGGGINHSHAVDLGDGNFAIQFFGGGPKDLKAIQPEMPAAGKAHAAALTVDKELQRVSTEIANAESQDVPEYALAVRDVDQPNDSPIYRRGDFKNLGELTPRGFLTAVPGSTAYSIPQESSGRLQLAYWLTDSRNPLTSRVLVNRIWHHIFGKGIVRTVDYFGVHGESPSHPELLDFLAARFQSHDKWSLRKTVRRMVLSRTYQMSSVYNKSAASVDPDNRLWWRMPRRRMQAESLRDAMLMVSGQLNPGRGGPSLGLDLDGNINGLGGNVNPPTWGGKIPDVIRNRRTVYLPLKRQRPAGDLEILSVFDFPHPSEITGTRPQTTVATQALFLMNAPSVKQQAAKLAERLSVDEPDDESARIGRLYLLTTSQPASRNDIRSASAFLDSCTTELSHDRHAAWVQLCHALLSSNRFLFYE